MKLAFKRAKGAGVEGFLINAFTGFGGVVHVECVFGNGETYSADSDRGVNVTRDRVYDAEHWELYDVGHDSQEPSALAFARSELGAPYDWRNLWSYVIPGMGQSDTAWICCEYATAICHRLALFLGFEPFQTNPRKLRDECRRRGFRREL